MKLSSLLVASVPLLGLVACVGDEFQATQPSGTAGGSTSSSITATATGGAGGHGGTGGTGGGTTSTGTGGSGGTGGGTTSTGTGGSGGTGGGTTSTGTGGSGGTGGSTATTGAGGTGGTDGTCSGSRECVLKPPPDWEGPVAFASASGPDELPECGAGGVAVEGGAAITAEPCTSCACGEPHNGSCGPTTLKGFGTAACDNALPVSPLTASAACLLVADLGLVSHVIAGRPAATGATCEASGGQPGAWSWTPARRTCTLPQHPLLACPDEHVCADRSDSKFDQPFCIFRKGTHPCPSGPYSESKGLYSGVNDTRACDKCACEAPMGHTCGGVVRFFDDSSCSDLKQAIPVDGTCSPWPGGPGAIRYSPAITGGSCAPQKVTPALSGEVEPKDPVTVCCMP